MSEIKFRVWIPDAVWATEADMFYQEDQYMSSFLDRIYAAYQVKHPKYLPFDINERFMQYTGLKDKNGVEIYEGDVVRHSFSENDFSQGAVRQHPNGEWLFDVHRSLWNHASRRLEVIGNIHETPELLNQQT